MRMIVITFVSLFTKSFCAREMPSYNTKWVLWLQAVMLFLLYFTPGDQFDAIPIYVAQAYLIMTSFYRAEDAHASKSAALLLMVAAVAGVISAAAALMNMEAVVDITVGTIHFAVMLAVAVIILCSSAHIIQYNKKVA